MPQSTAAWVDRLSKDSGLQMSSIVYQTYRLTIESCAFVQDKAVFITLTKCQSNVTEQVDDLLNQKKRWLQRSHADTT